MKPPRTTVALLKLVSRWVPWWAARVGLRDWRFEYGVGSLEAGTLATTEVCHPRRCARLTFASPEGGEWDMDPEVLIVHELLHIPPAEQVINSLAQALVGLRRGE